MKFITQQEEELYNRAQNLQIENDLLKKQISEMYTYSELYNAVNHFYTTQEELMQTVGIDRAFTDKQGY